MIHTRGLPCCRVIIILISHAFFITSTSDKNVTFVAVDLLLVTNSSRAGAIGGVVGGVRMNLTLHNGLFVRLQGCSGRVVGIDINACGRRASVDGLNGAIVIVIVAVEDSVDVAVDGTGDRRIGPSNEITADIIIGDDSFVFPFDSGHMKF
jgi:hypothetical protein